MSFTLIGCASINDMGDNFKDLVYGNPKESYIVQPGDSVWSIAIKLEIDPQLIILQKDCLYRLRKQELNGIHP